MAPPAPELEPLYPTRTPKGPAKYKAAVAARGSRDVPLTSLRFKPPDVPPLQRTLTDGPQAPLECFTDSLGLDIIVYSWPANSPTKGVILFCHGLDAFAEAEFAGGLDSPKARAIAARGLSCSTTRATCSIPSIIKEWAFQRARLTG